MTIIRIEHNCGEGLWKAENQYCEPIWRSFSFQGKLMEKHDAFPTPTQDNLTIEGDEYCAFKSIEQIQQWIEPEWFNEIIEMGFTIWMIDVSECKEGKFQVVFKKENILSRKDITELFLVNS